MTKQSAQAKKILAGINRRIRSLKAIAALLTGGGVLTEETYARLEELESLRDWIKKGAKP